MGVKNVWVLLLATSLGHPWAISLGCPSGSFCYSHCPNWAVSSSQGAYPPPAQGLTNPPSPSKSHMIIKPKCV